MSGIQLSADESSLYRGHLLSTCFTQASSTQSTALLLGSDFHSRASEVQVMLEEPRPELGGAEGEEEGEKVTLTHSMQPRSGPLPVPFLEPPYLKGQGWGTERG